MKIAKNTINAAAFIFERANGNLLGEYEQSEIRFYSLDGYEPDVLAAELRAGILGDNADDEYRSSAYWALGKRFDRELIPFFRERLAAEVIEAPLTVYSLMIALDNLNEPVFSSARNGSYSSSEYEMNLRDAQAYLRALRE